MKKGIRNILIKGLVIGSLLCILNSNLSAQGLTVTGTIDVTNLSVTSTINAASLTTSGSVGILGNLYVAGSVTLPNLNITSLANLTQITVSNNVTTANLSVTRTATVASLTNTGNEGIVGNLVVAGNTTVSTLTNTGNEGIVGNLVVAGNTTLNGNVTMSPSSAAGTISMGGAAGTGLITIGSSTALQGIALANGTGSMYITAGANTLGPANFYFGNSTANTAAVNTIIGSITNQANTTTIQGGNGTGAIAITPQTTGTIVIGAAAGTGAITVGSSSTTQTVNIGTGAGVATINLGTGNSASVINVGGVISVASLTASGTVKANVVQAGTFNTQQISTTATSIAFSQSGDTFGETGMLIQNRNGQNGPLFYNTNNVNAQLVDFSFSAMYGTANVKQYNFRYETRTASTQIAANAASAGGNGEFQILNVAGGNFVAAFGDYGIFLNQPVAASSTILIGGAAATGTITLGSSSAAQTVKIANGAGNSTVNIANVTNANNNVNIGDPQATAATSPVGTVKIAGSNLIVNGPICWGGTSGGAAQAQTLTLAITGPLAGQIIIFKAGFANTAAAPTLNVNGSGAKTIVKRAATALVANDIILNGVYMVLYNGTSWQLLNPTSAY
jgi:hypothetical protein